MLSFIKQARGALDSCGNGADEESSHDSSEQDEPTGPTGRHPALQNLDYQKKSHLWDDLPFSTARANNALSVSSIANVRTLVGSIANTLEMVEHSLDNLVEETANGHRTEEVAFVRPQQSPQTNWTKRDKHYFKVTGALDL